MSTQRVFIGLADLLPKGQSKPIEASTPIPPPIESLDLGGHAAMDWIPGFLLQGSFALGEFVRDEQEILNKIKDFGQTNHCKRWVATVHPSVLHKLPESLRKQAKPASPASPVDHLWITWDDYPQGKWRPDTVR